jgi:hypothetical protein
MFHPNIERLLDYWRSRRTGQGAPARTSIDPSEIPLLLPQVFMLGRKEAGFFRFRLVGGLIADLHRQDLRNADVVGLWAGEDRLRLAAALEAGRRRAEPFVVSAIARTAGGLECPVQILFAPLTDPDGRPDRVIGLYQPTALLARLSGRPVERLSIQRLLPAPESDSEETPALRLAVVDGRRIA